MQVHESSYIDEGAEIGEGTKIWHFCHVMSGAKIGKNCVIGQGCFIGKNVVIGDRCKIQNNVSIFEGVIIKDDVFIGPSVVFTNVKNPRAFIERKDEYKETIVKTGASIGANSTIICGIVIDEYSFVGAGSVVNDYVEPYSLVYGYPVEKRGTVNKEVSEIKWRRW